MKKYEYLIFDADHTLIDFEADEREAFRKIFALCGREADGAVLARCRALSVQTWEDVGLSDVDDAVIQRTYHELYRSHLPILFSRIFREFPCAMSPREAAGKFLVLLEEGGAPEKGAEKVLSALSEATGGKYRICVATNGLHAIQTGRLKGMEKYFYRVYISEDIGVIKPLSAFFARILSDLRTTPEKCLMIGDSLESDIAGAKGAGIDSCWVNPSGKAPAGVTPDYTVRELKELLPLLQ